MNKIFNSNVITRFAPSPTGYLHLGGARTALFNWIYAKKCGGKFLLRIEDTDKSRLKKDALLEIFEGLKWLGINWDDEVIYQSDRFKRYKDTIELLLKNGSAYKCYSTKDEIENFKKKCLKLGKSTKFVSPWRNKTQNSEFNKPFVVRLKVPEDGSITIDDGVQNKINWENKDLDDLILLRSDDSPTYNLAAVIDDHDYKITHVIRGDDHLTNTARQKLIYDALGWPSPNFSHIPLIHGYDGKKLSKRHGAVGINSYRSLGIKSSALVRYLCQLGLNTGDNPHTDINIIIKEFNIKRIVKGPARFDPVKLNDISGKILRKSPDIKILNDLINFIKYNKLPNLTIDQQEKIKNSLPFIKVRSKNLKDLYEQSKFILFKNKIKINPDCKKFLNIENLSLINDLSKILINIEWTRDSLNEKIKAFAIDKNRDFKDIAKLIRIAIVGTTNSPGIIDMMLIIGKNEIIDRLDILENTNE